MDPFQANALLTLIADLARIVYTAQQAPPAEPVVAEPAMNGHDPEKAAAVR